MKLTLNTVSQLAHVGLGVLLTLGILLFYPHWWAAVLGVTAIAAIKEFVGDGVFQHIPMRENLEDFLSVLAGIAVAMLVYYFMTR